MRRQLIGLVAVLGLMVACKASVEAEAHTSVEAKADSSGADDANDRAETSLPSEAPSTASSEVALAGARPDLTLSNPRAATACPCLAVAVGQPNDPLFSWQSGAPTTDPAGQAVVAFSSEGSGCGDGPGASYWGYQREGADVVVLVENARPGRPVVQGAIIPRPQSNGRVFVRQHTGPRGRAPDAGGCLLKFPANR
jgi:hypothetical protein